MGQREEYKMSKYFNTTEHKLKEQRKDRLMTALVYLTLAFAAIGVMYTFSLALTLVWGWVL